MESNILDKNYDLVFSDRELSQIFKSRCLDVGLDFAKMSQQFQKFKVYASKSCVNNKIVLHDCQLSLNFAKFLVGLILASQNLNSRLRFSPRHITEIDLKKNNLGDAGTKELCRCLTAAVNLVSLDLSSNHISHIGVQTLSESLSCNQSLQSLILNTEDGINRN